MKKFLIIIFCFFSLNRAYAQKPACGCVTKEGVNSVQVDGIVKYKGTSQTLGHTYEVNLVFINESKCSVKVENVLIGTTDIKPNILLAVDAKNRKKTFKKTLQLKTLLEPSVGLDDALFADLLVSYRIGSKECSNEVTVGYEKLTKK